MIAFPAIQLTMNSPAWTQVHMGLQHRRDYIEKAIEECAGDTEHLAYWENEKAELEKAFAIIEAKENSNG